MTNFNNLNIRFDIRRDTKKQSIINVFVRTDAENRKLFRQSLQIDTMGRWIGHKGWMGGNDEYSVKINKMLYELREKLVMKYLDLKTNESREPLGSEVVHSYFETIGQPHKSFMDLVDEYITTKGLSVATEGIYTQRIKRIFKKFLEFSLNGQSDISLHHIDLVQLYKFEMYLAVNYRKPNGVVLGRLTRNEYISKLKALMKYAHDMGYLKVYPFSAYRPQTIKTGAAKSPSLYSRLISPEDLHKIDSVNLPDANLQRCRNLFRYQSWTGMAYVDMEANANICKSIKQDLSGKPVILYNRIKTGELAIIPLFPELQTIIADLNDNIWPSDYNCYLALIKKMFNAYDIVFSKVNAAGAHTGRHVFGERMLAKGFSMEAVARMMGHTSIRITEKIYAKIDETKIFSDYQRILNNQQLPA